MTAFGPKRSFDDRHKLACAYEERTTAPYPVVRCYRFESFIGA